MPDSIVIRLIQTVELIGALTVTREPSVPADPALAALLPLVYDELRALAQAHLRNERCGHTLSATELVNEAYLRLQAQRTPSWRNKPEFMAAASQAIRRILVDHARTRLRAKRGGDQRRIELSTELAWAEPKSVDLVALDDALAELAQLNERQARVVEMRFFGGMSIDEVAEHLGLSPRTIDGEWSMARAWLRRTLKNVSTE